MDQIWGVQCVSGMSVATVFAVCRTTDKRWYSCLSEKCYRSEMWHALFSQWSSSVSKFTLWTKYFITPNLNHVTWLSEVYCSTCLRETIPPESNLLPTLLDSALYRVVHQLLKVTWWKPEQIFSVQECCLVGPVWLLNLFSHLEKSVPISISVFCSKGYSCSALSGSHIVYTSRVQQ